MKRTILASTFGILATTSFAQSSVTLYGAIDNGIGYLSNSASKGAQSGGKSQVSAINGVWLGSRFGLKGAEDLGGGTKAIFTIESGFNSNNGAMSWANSSSALLFGRQAFVGLASDTYGTLTAGRQYASYYQMLSPYSPTNWLTGYYGAHPGDIDGLDTIYRINNALIYTSPTMAGVTVSGTYALGGVPGRLGAGQTWSLAAKYGLGPVGMAVGFERLSNAAIGGGPWDSNSTANSLGEPGNSSLTYGFQTAATQQRFAVTAGYAFNSQWDISASYSNVQYVAGTNSSFHDTQIWNTGGMTLHYKPFATLDLAAGYAYTRATRANGVTSAAWYSQFNLGQYVSLSKRTGIYVLEGYQRAGGQTINIVNGVPAIVAATANLGDGQNGTPASGRTQVGIGAGVVHRF
ncbi:porin [Paraburkholderia sp. EG285A]|uniref:porin n=1 Tax=Paraburkholderia sp. EG285A TaxID=3237009 RepID=UPI0034D2DB45